jgi:hypothetical protein
MNRTFLPDRLRPRAPRKRSRKPVLLMAVLPLTLVVLPMWRVQAVDVSGCSGLPSELMVSLDDLVGRPTLAVSPQWVRHQLEAWPAVSAVEVRLDLPGTLRISATHAKAHGSVPVGTKWHAVTASGTLGGNLDAPIEPVLSVTPGNSTDVRRALAVARRIAGQSGGHVRGVRPITPTDYEVDLVPLGTDRPVLMRVRPEATRAEMQWCRGLTRGESSPGWVDRRWDDRVVLGGAG